MKDQLSMFEMKTSEVTPSAISSPASGSGVTPSDSPSGQMTVKSGQAPAPANPSARQARAKRSTTKGIFGQSSFGSSRHEDLSFALANRLRPLTDSLGSTLFNLTWMTRITPAGRSISALRASAPLIEGSVCIGWPTPDASVAQDGESLESWQSRREKLRGQKMNGNGCGVPLTMAALMAAWPTTSGSDGERSGEMTQAMSGTSLTQVAKMAGWKTPTACSPSGQEPADREAGGHAVNLQDQVRLAGWKIPCVPNGGRISGNTADIGKHQDGTKAQIGLENEAKLSGWATPKVQRGDYQYGNGDHSQINLNLIGQARLTAFGEKPIGFLLGPNGWEIVPASGQLNAAHSRWLMGLPPAWDDCGVMGMGSSRKRQKHS